MVDEAALYKMQRGAGSWKATREPEQVEGTLRRRLRRYQSEEGTAPTYGCLCEQNKTYQSWTSKNWLETADGIRTNLGKKADCVCDYLDQYAKLASGHISDTELDLLYKDTRKKLMDGLLATTKRIELLSANMKTHDEDEWAEDWVLDHIESPEIENIHKIIGLIRQEPENRQDRVTFVDSFVQLVHKGGSLLPTICAQEVGVEVGLGDTMGGIVEDILDCLFDDPGKELIIGRMKGGQP